MLNAKAEEIIQHMAANKIEIINFKPCLLSVLMFKNKNINKKDTMGIIYKAPIKAIDSNTSPSFVKSRSLLVSNQIDELLNSLSYQKHFEE